MSFLNPRTEIAPRHERRTQPEVDIHLRSLAHVVIVTAQRLDERMLGPIEPEVNPAFDGRTLLATLAFCYARQIYGSMEIAARLRRDPKLRRLCGDDVPDAATLRRFRSANRGALQFCLKAGLRCWAEQKIAEGWLTKVSEAHLAEEARRRVIMAMFTDSQELDDQRASGPAIEIPWM